MRLYLVKSEIYDEFFDGSIRYYIPPGSLVYIDNSTVDDPPEGYIKLIDATESKESYWVVHRDSISKLEEITDPTTLTSVKILYSNNKN